MSNVKAVLTPNEIRVIRERHFGWEKATVTTLAAVFGVSRQRIASVLYPVAGEDAEK